MFESINRQLTEMQISPVDIGVLIGYFLLMMAVGYACRKASVNISDYVRMGNKGSWWLIGLSIFMQAVSAITFTANCGVAYMAGWSAFWTSLGGILGLLIQGFFLAGWMRKTRAITPADAIRIRFGPVMEQIFVYVGVFSSMLWGGVFLLSLASFMSATFNLPVTWVILFAGIVVVFYSVSGGSWSVMITDSLQSLMMVPICLVLAFLSLRAVGGFSGLAEGIQSQGLAGDFRLIVEPDHVYTTTAGKIGKGYFTFAWVLASMMFAIIQATNMTGCYRYLAAKGCEEARKAAFFAAGLLLVGSMIWFIPPMVARVLYQADVEALTSLNNPADGAYAVIAKKLLPPGLLGLMITAMFAAAMSSIDSFLTGTAGLVGQNIMPPLRRRLKMKPFTDKGQLRFTKGVNLAFGMWSMCLAYILNKNSGGGGIYDITLQIILLVGGPMGLPYTLSFFVKKLPSWAPLVGMAFGMTASAIFTFGPKHGLEGVANLLWHQRIYISVAVTLIPTYATSLFWNRTPASYKKLVSDFFLRLKTPIDYKTEVGESDDHSQLILVGKLGGVVSLLLLILLFFVHGTEQVLSVLFVSLIIGGITGAMYLKGLSVQKREHGRSVVPVTEAD